MKKKIVKWAAVGVMIFFLGGIGGFVFDKYFAPFLGSCKIFSKYDLFQGPRKNTTIIKETERIVVKDDNSVNELASAAAQSVVDIFAIEEVQASNFLARKTENNGKKGVGTILTNDGVIVTHQENVSEDGVKYYVTVFDGTVFEADLIGIEEFSELAFLKIEGANLPAIPFANSNDAVIGKKVIAIGGSLGNEQVSITEGPLSDYDETFNLAGKNLASSEKLEGVFLLSFVDKENYIGGPVIDYNGELVAINSAVEIDNKKEYFQIPSNKIKKSMNSVFSGDLERTGKLGVYYVSVDSFYSRLNDLSVGEGAMIYSASGSQGLAVIANSTAAKAGIRINDIVTHVNGEKIDLNNSLSSYISNYKVGDEIELRVIRAGEEITIKVSL